ncbi:MAG: TonB-dependent receptor [Bacteroidota bacterium]
MKLKILLNICLLLLVSVGYAQTTVSGTVTDENGESLPGVSIIIKGTSIGTVTDFEGKYKLEVSDDSAILIYSFVGYSSSEFVVTGGVMDITLYEDVTELEELVVVGYGTQKRRDITSSIGSVDSDDVANVAATYSFDGAIQGKLSGVFIGSSSATPGSAFNLNVRGVTSIGASSQPLIVVDGIPILTGNQSALNNNIQPINPLANINPNDIESISVLKDASAAAIYGTRGANGVILITTKTGSIGKTKVNVGYSIGISEIANTPEMMTSKEWIEFMNAAAEFDGLGENYWNDILGDPNDPNLPNHNVYDEIFRTGITHNMDVGLSGGNEDTKYVISANYFDQTGIQLGQGFERFNTRLRMDHSLNDKVGVGANILISRGAHQRTVNENDEYGVVVNAQAWDPTAPLTNQDGSYTNPFDFNGWWALDNPLFIAEQYVNNSTSNRILASTYAEWEVAKNLNFKSTWSADYNSLIEESFTPVGSNEAPTGAGIYATLEELVWINENTLTYSTTIGQSHNLNILGGFSIQESNVDFSEINGNGFPNNQIIKIGAAANTTGSSSATSYGFLSYLGRVTYDFQNKYLIQGSFRIDGSSRFGPDNRYALLPSGSVGWRFSNESFFQGISNVVSEGKLRASYGVVGNAEIGNFTWQGLWGASSYNGVGGSNPSVLGNPQLGWEQTTQLDIGLDLTLFGRIGIVADYFQKSTTDLLLDVDVPGTLGFANTTSNIGEIENKGFEFAINSQNISGKDFQWTTNINFTTLRNKVVDVLNNGQILSRNFVLLENESLSQLYLIKFLGVDPTTGDAIFEDLNSDGLINLDDRQAVGSGLPDYFGGINNSFRYKDFSLSVFFQFVGGNKIFNQSRHAYENYGTTRGGIPYGNQTKRSLDYWREPGDITAIPRPTLIGPEDAGNPELQWQRFSTQYLEDGDFVRLKNVKFSYNVPAKILSRFKLNSAIIYVQGQNLFTWTDYLGFDPEVNTNTSGEGLNTLQGEDFGTLGQARTYSVGLNIEF